MLRKMQEIQPISTTAIPRYIAIWANSADRDVTCVNPKINSIESCEQTPENSIAIYCVHGTADRVSSFNLFADRIIDNLPETISTLNLISFNHRLEGKGIEFFAEHLKQKILTDKNQNVIVIGHSRGGLVAAYFAEYLAKAANINVQAVVAICAPFAGSDLAMAPLSWISESVNQMSKGSLFLKDLDEKLQHSLHKYYCFSAQDDWIVPFPSSEVRNGSSTSILLDRHGHMSIMCSRRLVTHIQHFLVEICERFIANHQQKSLPAIASALDIICQQINTRIGKLKVSNYIYSAATKVEVLEKLNHLLNEINAGRRGLDYPEASTVGGLIAAFLQDSHLGNGRTPMAIISQPLNYPFSLLHGPKTETQAFLENLIVQGKDILIPAIDYQASCHPERSEGSSSKLNSSV